MKKFSIKVFIVLMVCVFLLWIVVSIAHTGIILATSIQVFRFLQMFVYVATGLVVLYGLVSVVFFMQSRAKAKVEEHRLRKEDAAAHAAMQTDPVRLLEHNVKVYLQEKPTTPFFKENLTFVIDQIPIMRRQVDSVVKVAKDRFGEGSLSYNQFVLPVQHLFDHLLKLGIDLVQKLDMFDAVRYQSKIEAAHTLKDASHLQEYVDVMNAYQEYVHSILNAFEQTSLKLDKLIVEMGKLSNEDLVHSITALQELDSVIINTKLYKD